MEQHAWKAMFRDYWGKFRVVKGHHNVFQDHANELDCCVPVMLHGDEGRGKLRRAVRVTSIQPVLVPDGHAGHSFNSRFLHSIMPGELYAGDATMSILQEALVEELRNLYTEGFEVPSRCFKQMCFLTVFMHASHEPQCLQFSSCCCPSWACMHACKVTAEDGKKHRLFIVLTGVKGDWVYLRILAGCLGAAMLNSFCFLACLHTHSEPEASVTNLNQGLPRRGNVITAVRGNLAYCFGM